MTVTQTVSLKIAVVLELKSPVSKLFNYWCWRLSSQMITVEWLKFTLPKIRRIDYLKNCAILWDKTKVEMGREIHTTLSWQTDEMYNFYLNMCKVIVIFFSQFLKSCRLLRWQINQQWCKQNRRFRDLPLWSRICFFSNGKVLNKF